MSTQINYYGVPPSQQMLVELRYLYTATSGQTSFNAQYGANYSLDVYYNGSHTEDYTATDNAHVVLNTPAVAGALVRIIARPLVPSSVAYVPYSGATMTGPMTLYGGDVGVTPAANTTNLTLLSTVGYVNNAIAPVQGLFKNLQVSATGTTAAVSVSYDALSLTDGNGNWFTDTAATGTITTTTTGLNGLDTGALAASTWYSVWRIASVGGVNKGWLFSLSATAPTMPSGYVLKARFGWFRTDSTANKYPLSFIQYGRSVQYKVVAGSNVVTLPQMDSANTTTAWKAVSTVNFVPTTASAIIVCGMANSSSSGSNGIGVAPSNAYTATFGGSNVAPMMAYQGASNGTPVWVNGKISLESTNIYWIGDGSNSVSYLDCLGWEDNF